MKLTAIRTMLVGVGLTLLSAAAAGAQTRTTPKDVNGEWEGVLELEEGTHNLSLVFRLTDTTFAGTVYDGARPFGDMANGRLSGDTVRFTVDVLKFTGVVKGTKMEVALIVFNGSTRNFTVVKKPSDNKEH